MIKKNWPNIVIFILIIFYFIFFSYFSILRHHDYYSYRFDLGNMEQVIWNTVKGKIFIFTDPEGFGNISRLKYHADFFLLLIAPIYALFPKTETLLILQSLGIALGVLPIYWLAKDVLKKNSLSLIPVLLYLLYPALQRSNYFDFHAVTFATTFLLFSFWYLHKKFYWQFIFFSILAILCKEQIPLIVLLLTIYGIFKDKKFRIPGIIFSLLSILYFWYVFFRLIPQFHETNKHFIFKYFTSNDLSEDFSKINLNPGFLKDKSVWIMFLQLLLPLSFLPLLSPFYLIFSFPDLIPRILSTNIHYRSIDFQYTNPVIPFIFISFIYGLNKAVKAFKKFRVPILVGLILILIIGGISVYFWSPFSGYFAGIKAGKIISGRQEKNYIDQFKKIIPDDKSVCTTNNLGAHFARRLLLYSFPNNVLESDYALILKGDGNMISQETTDRYLQKLNQSSHHRKIGEYQDFIAFRKIN